MVLFVNTSVGTGPTPDLTLRHRAENRPDTRSNPRTPSGRVGLGSGCRPLPNTTQDTACFENNSANIARKRICLEFNFNFRPCHPTFSHTSALLTATAKTTFPLELQAACAFPIRHAACEAEMNWVTFNVFTALRAFTCSPFSFLREEGGVLSSLFQGLESQGPVPVETYSNEVPWQFRSEPQAQV